MTAKDATKHRALSKEFRHSSQTHEKRFDENRRLGNEYEHALMLFTSAYGRMWAFSMNAEDTLRDSIQSRLGFKELRC